MTDSIPAIHESMRTETTFDQSGGLGSTSLHVAASANQQPVPRDRYPAIAGSSVSVPTGTDTGILKLVYESTSAAILEAPDNLHFTPRGGILLCEDRGGFNFLRGLTPAGVVFDFVVHAVSNSEVAGATFSRDGQTLFFNYQNTGETFAVWPRDGQSWEEGAL